MVDSLNEVLKNIIYVSIEDFFIGEDLNNIVFESFNISFSDNTINCYFIGEYNILFENVFANVDFLNNEYLYYLKLKDDFLNNRISNSNFIYGVDNIWFLIKPKSDLINDYLFDSLSYNIGSLKSVYLKYFYKYYSVVVFNDDEFNIGDVFCKIFGVSNVDFNFNVDHIRLILNGFKKNSLFVI